MAQPRRQGSAFVPLSPERVLLARVPARHNYVKPATAAAGLRSFMPSRRSHDDRVAETRAMHQKSDMCTERSWCRRDCGKRGQGETFGTVLRTSWEMDRLEGWSNVFENGARVLQCACKAAFLA